MSELHFVQGDITKHPIKGRLIIAHVVDSGGGDGDGTWGLFEEPVTYNPHSGDPRKTKSIWPVRAAYYAHGMHPWNTGGKHLLNQLDGDFRHGDVLFFKVNSGIEIANLSAFGYRECVKDESVHGGFRHLPPKVDLLHLRKCLERLAARALPREELFNKTPEGRRRCNKPYQEGRVLAEVAMPRIGCGKGGRTWEEVEPLVREILVGAGVDVFVYDP